MSRRQQPVRAVAQLRTAAADARDIAAQREAARGPTCATGGIVPSEASELVPKQTPSQQAWLSPLQPADLALAIRAPSRTGVTP